VLLHNTRRRLLLLLALLAAGCDSATVPERDRNEAYDFRLYMDQDSPVLRWPNASRIRVFLNPNTVEERNAELLAAFRHASAVWENASLFVDYRFAQASSPQLADVIITWSGSPLPVETAQCLPTGGGDAFTWFCVNEQRTRLVPFPLSSNHASGSVRIVVAIRDVIGGNPQRVRSLIAHELGHVLGLVQHSTSADDLMFEDPLVRDQPNTRDRVTVQILYQTRADITP
jgi:hypothetical protein